MSHLFTAPYAWAGGFYELAVELGPRSDERLQAALEAIWRREGLDGCYEDCDVEPSDQPQIAPTLETRLFGVATMPKGQQVACGTIIVREDEGPDWICFYLPLGALNTAYDVGGYPFGGGSSSRPWREPLDDWLVRIAAAVFVAAPFPLALIGHEVSGTDYTDEVQKTGVPEERWAGMLWREDDRLVWHSPTKYEAYYTFPSNPEQATPAQS